MKSQNFPTDRACCALYAFEAISLAHRAGMAGPRLGSQVPADEERGWAERYGHKKYRFGGLAAAAVFVALAAAGLAGLSVA